MKALAPLVLIGGALVGLYLFVTGKIPGYGQGTPDASGATDAAKDAGGKAVQGGSALTDWWFGHGWAYTATIAGVLAFLGVITWKKIGGWGRAAVLVAATIAVTVLVTR
jgi:hypothetical protein